jgi:hypothetical protein
VEPVRELVGPAVAVVAAFLAGAGMVVAVPRIACAFRGHPAALRQPLGGVRCASCLTAAANEIELHGGAEWDAQASEGDALKAKAEPALVRRVVGGAE